MLITICMRKGSERFPDKHIQVINGKSLYVWTLEQAVIWGKGDIVVSTDDKAIQDRCINHPHWVLVNERDPRLADSYTPKLAAVREALEFAEEDMGRQYNTIIDLDVTNPMRKLSHIEGALKVFNDLNGQYPVVSVTRSHRSPYFNMLEPIDYDKYKGQPIALLVRTAFKEIVMRSQDMPKTYDINASIYVYPRDFVLNRKKISPVARNKVAYYVMPPETFIDIDEPFHLVAVETLMRRYGYA